MEEYWALNWSRRNHRTEEQFDNLVSHDANRDLKDVWNLHLNEIDPHLVASSSTSTFVNDNRPFVDPRNNRAVENPEIIWGKGLNTRKFHLFNLFPCGSALKRHEHIRGIKALNAASKKVHTEEDLELFKEFALLQEKIAIDRGKFHEFVKEYSLARLGDRYSHPDTDLINLGTHRLSFNKPKSDESFYTIQTGIRSSGYDDLPEMQLEFVEELKTFGLLPRIKFAMSNPLQAVLPKPVERGKDFLQKDPEITRNFKSFLAELGKKTGGFCVNSELMYHIISSDCKSCSWAASFFVHESEKSENFIYFDSPTIKSQHCSQLELEQQGLDLCYRSSVSMATLQPYSFDEGCYLLRKNEHFPKRSNSQMTQKIVEEDDEDDDARLVIDNVEDEPQLEGGKDEIETEKGVEEEYKLTEFNEYLTKLVKKDHKEPQNFLINRFKLKIPDDPQDVPLIVTSSCDGVYRTGKDPDQFVALTFKIEYKSDFGAQTMSREELLKEWCTIAFSSQIQSILRVRVDYSTSVIMSLVQLTREDIEKELNRLYQIKPEKLLFTVANLLKIIQKFPVGKYLLNKDKNNNQILIYMATGDSGKSWNEIVNSVANTNSIGSRVPPLADQPIDDQIVTPLHKIHQVIPGCIPSEVKKNPVVCYKKKPTPFAKRKQEWQDSLKEAKKKKKWAKKKINKPKPPSEGGVGFVNP